MCVQAVFIRSNDVARIRAAPYIAADYMVVHRHRCSSGLYLIIDINQRGDVNSYFVPGDKHQDNFICC